MVLNGVFRMGRGVNGVRTYGTQSESFTFFYFCVSLYGNPVAKLCSFGFWTFGTLRTGGRSPRGSQSASPQPLPQKAPTNFNKFQQISTKSFASRRSLTAKSCRPIGNKKNQARTQQSYTAHIVHRTHARNATNHRKKTHAMFCCCPPKTDEFADFENRLKELEDANSRRGCKDDG